MLQPSDCVYSESLTPQGKLVACHRDLTEILVCKYPFVFMNQFLRRDKSQDSDALPKNFFSLRYC